MVNIIKKILRERTFNSALFTINHNKFIMNYEKKNMETHLSTNKKIKKKIIEKWNTIKRRIKGHAETTKKKKKYRRR